MKAQIYYARWSRALTKAGAWTQFCAWARIRARARVRALARVKARGVNGKGKGKAGKVPK
jgi:hypothetical protein